MREISWRARDIAKRSDFHFGGFWPGVFRIFQNRSVLIVENGRLSVESPRHTRQWFTPSKDNQDSSQSERHSSAEGWKWCEFYAIEANPRKGIKCVVSAGLISSPMYGYQNVTKFARGLTSAKERLPSSTVSQSAITRIRRSRCTRPKGGITTLRGVIR